MKNIQKTGFILTLLIFSSVGCSSSSLPKISSDLPSILENPISGKEVILRGKIVGKIEECHIFTDGSNKILVHFEDEELAYNPDTTLEISGTIEKGIMPGKHHFVVGHYGDISMDTMIMVNKFQIITAEE